MEKHPDLVLAWSIYLKTRKECFEIATRHRRASDDPYLSNIATSEVIKSARRKWEEAVKKIYPEAVVEYGKYWDCKIKIEQKFTS